MPFLPLASVPMISYIRIKSVRSCSVEHTTLIEKRHVSVLHVKGPLSLLPLEHVDVVFPIPVVRERRVTKFGISCHTWSKSVLVWDICFKWAGIILKQAKHAHNWTFSSVITIITEQMFLKLIYFLTAEFKRCVKAVLNQQPYSTI